MYNLRFIKILSAILIIFISTGYSQLNVACVGNSITIGSATSSSYPGQLGTLLGGSYTVHNYGHASTTVLKNGENTYWNVPIFTHATGFPRDIVVITFGTNATRSVNWDSHSGEFKTDYLSLISKFKKWDSANHKTIFIVCLPPPILNDYSSWGVKNAILKNEVIPKLKSIASQTGATIANFYNTMQGHPDWFLPDGVHPNDTGNAIMAQIVENAIKKALTTNPPSPISAPHTPVGFKAIPQLNSILLQWAANTETNLSGYHLYRATELGGAQSYIGTVSTPKTTFTDNNVTRSQRYYYSISAYNSVGKVSPRSATLSATTLDNIPPALPTAILLSHRPDTVFADWTANNEIDLLNYYLYRDTDHLTIQDPNNIIGSIFAPIISFTDLDVQPGVTYYYGLTAVDFSGNQSAISNIVNIHISSAPVSNDTTITTFEDIPHPFSTSDFPFIDVDDHSFDKLIFINSNHLEYFSYNGNPIDTTIVCDDISKLIFSSEFDDFGDDYANFEFKVIDDFGAISVDTNLVTINVASVNDVPIINVIPDIEITEDSENILVAFDGVNSGSAEESQNLSVKTFATDTTLLKVSSIQYNSPEESGSLILDPIENVFGVIPMYVMVTDDGGIVDGGIDTVITSFNINILPINDPPIFNILENIEIFEDSETQVELFGIQAGPFGETNQQITMSVKSNNNAILPNPELNYNSPAPNANLNFTTIPNIFGSASITISMKDDGGTDLGGNDSTIYTIPVNIISVNDMPDNFNIIKPFTDSTIVINKFNFNDTLKINWAESTDIENDDISYDIVFNGDLSSLSRYNISTTNTEYILRDVLALTDTVSIAKTNFDIIASDGQLQTVAQNSGIELAIDGRSLAPAKLNLDQNYPNPFNNRTLIGFDLPSRTRVTIIIYDLLGNEIIRLINNKSYDRGYGSIAWEGMDKNNNHVAAGVYFVQLLAGTDTQHKKILFLK